MASQHLVIGIADADDQAAVGGKGASLGSLSRAGLPVPPGFVVTVQAFEQAMRAVDPAGEIAGEIERLSAADAAELASVTAGIRNRVAAAPLPGELSDAIAVAYRALGTGGQAESTAVAVRSSATGEDAAEASHAGLQDTYLWLCGERQVVDHVRRCWASLYNAEAVSYRLRQQPGDRAAAMAVVVQRMVEPRSAGVMFTCSPASGDRSVVAIEGSWGLGSALVGGEVTPDSFVVSKVTGEIVQRIVAAKMRLDRCAAGGLGTTSEDVAADQRERPCLDDDEIRSLARLALRVEQHYGPPQDIEWAVTGDEIMLLQSRPETVWSSRPTAPVATPKARPMDHVFEQLGRPVFVKKDSS
jgi:pyruvate, water dikinase